MLKKVYLDLKVSQIDGHLLLLEKDYNEFKLHYNKQSVEEILIQRAVKTSIQILSDKGSIAGFSKEDEILKNFLFVTGRRGYLEEVNDVIQ